MIGLAHYLTVAAILFTIGVLGIFLNRRNVILMLMAIELILLAVNINLVAFSAYLGDLTGQVLAMVAFPYYDNNIFSRKRSDEEVKKLFDPEKNVQSLVEAFLAADPPADLRLALAGSGSERRRLQARYQDHRLAFLGSLTDESERIALLRSAEAFFLPSSIEGLSLALLEAMACGACPVATDVGVDGDAVRGAGVVLEPLHLDSELRLAPCRSSPASPEVTPFRCRPPGCTRSVRRTR